MKSFLITSLFVILVLLGCRPARDLRPYMSNTAMYSYVNRHIFLNKDSTYSYTLVDDAKKIFYPYNYLLLDSLRQSGRVRGRADFYSLINEKGQVVSIELYQVVLSSMNNKRVTYVYNQSKNFDSDSLYTLKLKNFLLQEVSKIKPNINATPTGIHPTFCSFNFVTE